MRGEGQNFSVAVLLGLKLFSVLLFLIKDLVELKCFSNPKFSKQYHCFLHREWCLYFSDNLICVTLKKEIGFVLSQLGDSISVNLKGKQEKRSQLHIVIMMKQMWSSNWYAPTA